MNHHPLQYAAMHIHVGVTFSKMVTLNMMPLGLYNLRNGSGMVNSFDP